VEGNKPLNNFVGSLYASDKNLDASFIPLKKADPFSNIHDINL
jgi:hypothetical protein